MERLRRKFTRPVSTKSKVENQDPGSSTNETALATGSQQSSALPSKTDGGSTAVSTRVSLAQQRVQAACIELLESLQQYYNDKGAAQSSIIDISDLDVSSAQMLSATVEGVLLNQQSQEMSVASKIGDFMGKIYPLASLALGLGSAAAEGGSFLPIKGVVNSLSLLLQIAEKERTRTEDFEQQLSRIVFQALRVGEIQRLQSGTVGDLLVEKAANLMAAMLCYLKSALIFFRYDYFSKLAKALVSGAGVYADGRAALDLAIAEYDQALLLEVTIKVLEMNINKAPLLEPSKKQKLAELLTWIGAGSEFESQYIANCEIRAPGTLNWILDCEEFKAWRLQKENTAKFKPLWLSGLPGVGKSVIAAYITQVLTAQHPDALVIYFFCKAGESNMDNFESIFRGLAAQLAKGDETCQERLQQLKDLNDPKPSSNTWSIFARFVRGVVNGLSRRIIVVIDGLDECKEIDEGITDGSIDKLVESLEKTGVQLLISSRPTPSISYALRSGVKKTVTFEDSRDDIEKYAAMRISRSNNLKKGFIRISKEPAVYMAEKSNGSFLWTRTVLDILERTASVKAFKTAFDSIPSAIGGVYDKILDRLETAGTLEAAMVILECVLFSIRPMTIDELYTATALLWDEILDMERFLEDDCGSFLALVPGTNGRSVHILHETFRAYLTDTKIEGPRNLKPARSHARIATACLACLTTPSSDDTKSPRISKEDDDFLEVDKFRNYSTENFVEHLRISNDKVLADGHETVLMLLAAIHEFFHDEVTLRKWMGDWILMRPTNRAYDVGLDITNVYDDIMAWISADFVTTLLDSAKDTDYSPEIALWREEACKDGSYLLAETMSNNFTWVWLNTNWKTFCAAGLVFEGALTFVRILQLAGEPKEEPDRIQWPRGMGPEAHLTEEQKSKPGWTWRYPSSISTGRIVSVEQLTLVGSNGWYDNSIGIQAGNFAVGEYFADSPNCIRDFKYAIDENPERWYLYEGLARWYQSQDENDKALEYYTKAMELDEEEPPSCALDYYTLLAGTKAKEGALAEAEDAFRKGAAMKLDWDGNVYWNRMAKLYEDIKDWDSVIRVRREAIEKHPVCQSHYWSELNEAYKSAGDWRGGLEALLEAIQKDPENEEDYLAEIGRIGGSLRDLHLWDPASQVYSIALERMPSTEKRFKSQLALVFMGHGGHESWQKAVPLLLAAIDAKLAENCDREYEDLAICYLGLGEYAKCHAAIKAAMGDDYMYSDRTILAYIVEGEYQKAIQVLRARLTRLSGIPGYGADPWKASVLLERHMTLGFCYDAVARTTDATASFEAAAKSFEGHADKLHGDIVEGKPGYPISRLEARMAHRYGIVLERLGKLIEAKKFYEAAVIVSDLTTFVGDDEILVTEAAEMEQSLNRVTRKLEGDENSGSIDLNSVLEKPGSIQLQRRLCMRVRTNYSAYTEGKKPRYRGYGDGYAKLLL
ncbi:hypothetical protein TWF694_011374 [Orbilia ellipsospora]|uniref:NACHT domain-containing protein n=1 Tax=Orbilia ellipsospora TaxID=2528407 RepID=A0AAV9X671_9PEZI